MDIKNINIGDIEKELKNKIVKAKTEPPHRKHVHITMNKMGMNPKLARLMNRDKKKKRKS